MCERKRRKVGELPFLFLARCRTVLLLAEYRIDICQKSLIPATMEYNTPVLEGRKRVLAFTKILQYEKAKPPLFVRRSVTLQRACHIFPYSRLSMPAFQFLVRIRCFHHWTPLVVCDAGTRIMSWPVLCARHGIPSSNFEASEKAN